MGTGPHPALNYWNRSHSSRLVRGARVFSLDERAAEPPPGSVAVASRPAGRAARRSRTPDHRIRLRDGDSLREPGLRRRIVDEARDEQGSKNSGCADYTIKRLHGGFLQKNRCRSTRQRHGRRKAIYPLDCDALLSRGLLEALIVVRRPRVDGHVLCADAGVGVQPGTITIHVTPKRSAAMPKRGEKNVLPSGICTAPPSARAANTRSASAASFAA